MAGSRDNEHISDQQVSTILKNHFNFSDSYVKLAIREAVYRNLYTEGEINTLLAQRPSKPIQRYEQKDNTLKYALIGVGVLGALCIGLLIFGISKMANNFNRPAKVEIEKDTGEPIVYTEIDGVPEHEVSYFEELKGENKRTFLMKITIADRSNVEYYGNWIAGNLAHIHILPKLKLYEGCKLKYEYYYQSDSLKVVKANSIDFYKSHSEQLTFVSY